MSLQPHAMPPSKLGLGLGPGLSPQPQRAHSDSRQAPASQQQQQSQFANILPIIPSMFHAVLCQTADVFNSPARHHGRSIIYTNAQLGTSVPALQDRFHYALDVLEADIMGAKMVIHRDYRRRVAEREKAEAEAEAEAVEAGRLEDGNKESEEAEKAEPRKGNRRRWRRTRRCRTS
ncbi:hypothetical protein BZA05DRAFT_146640 [Tricharina praecox]|uniref:uncharacterized protein n=1 Tax=Tricharina praecox TaxID=43433 RepID=UPI002220CA4F|nr:uncharacterized protein BZA05DRAFT_146640 [Tricharina praecox]KAI5845523.1 hypothetical protein BZA05DRAFT_146640 [Tricharina praecox]